MDNLNADRDQDKDSAVKNAARISANSAQKKTSGVSSEYTRKNYVDQKKMDAFKDKQFGKSAAIKDPYTDAPIHKSQKAATNKYGPKKASAHRAQTDHIDPIKHVYDNAKGMSYITDADIKSAVNKDHNFKVINQKDNVAKLEQTGSEYANKNKSLSDSAKKQMTKDYRVASTKVTAELLGKDLGRAAKSGAAAGAAAGAIISGGQNIAAVVRGDKEVVDALFDTAKDTVKSGAMGAGMKTTAEGLKVGADALAKQVTKKSLSKAGAKAAEEALIKQVGQKGISQAVSQGLTWVSKNAGNIVTVIVTFGDSFVKYIKGDIDGEQLILELGEKGTGLAGMLLAAPIGEIAGSAVGGLIGGAIGTYFAPGAGTALGVKIGEFVGGVIACAVGYFLGSELFRRVKAALVGSQSIAESKRLQEIYNQIYEKIKEANDELENYLSYVHTEHRNVIKENFAALCKAGFDGDTEKATQALNNICGQFNFSVRFENDTSFEKHMANPSSAFSIGTAR